MSGGMGLFTCLLVWPHGGGVSSKGADSRPQERHCHLLSSSLG